MVEELMITQAGARSGGVPGRSVVSARSNHFVIDEPAYAGGPGEATTPAEAFHGAVAAAAETVVEVMVKADGS